MIDENGREKKVPIYAGKDPNRKIVGWRPLDIKDIQSYFRSIAKSITPGHGCQRCGVLIGKRQDCTEIHYWRGWELCYKCYLIKDNQIKQTENTPDLEDVERFGAYID